MLLIAVDVGQPIRMWYIYWHANIHSMLTEVAFCISLYFGVLCIEYLPLFLENRKLNAMPFFNAMSRNMHGIMPVFAATGVFLSFFHQGSLGGMPGVLYGRPFAFREGLHIWPSTFFLFILSAAGVGPCFTIFLSRITEKVTRKRLVGNDAIQLLAKIAGWILLTYIMAKIADTIYWALRTAPSQGISISKFYSENAFTALGFYSLKSGFAV
jgi:molybdopterin-containing oxidoreductase family membrane subunit